jgi:class 3 adenylate cyclase
MPRGADRFVATVLFTDVVGSTEMAAEVGDRRWNAVLRVYYGVARREVRRFHGREIDTAGDGFFATFVAPNDGVRAAAAIVESMWARGVPIRAGLHAGECEIVGKKVGGIAVHIGARVASLAGAGEVVVTSTVRDLAAGSALRFDSMGARELKGVPGEWNVFEVGSEAPRPDLPALDVPDPGDPGQGRSRRGALIAGIVAAVVAIGVVAALVVNSSKGSPAAATSAPGSPTASASGSASGTPSGVTGGQFLGAVAVDSDTGKATARVPFNLTSNADVSGHDIASGAGFVWVSDFSANTVSKVNPATGTVVATIPVTYPSSLLVHGEDVWVASGYPGCTPCALVRIDALTNEPHPAGDLAVCCGGMAIDGGNLWLLGTENLFRVNLASGKSTKFAVGGDAIAAGAGRMFVLSRGLATLTTVNERTGELGAPVPLTSSSPTFVAYGFGAVWITDRSNDVVTRLPVNGRGGGDEIRVGSEPVGVARGPDAMWVANASDGTVSEIDAGGSVEATREIGGRPTRLTVAFGSVWMTDVPTPS